MKAVQQGVNLVLDAAKTATGQEITVRDQADGGRLLGWIDVEVIEGNIVVSVCRVDEAWFGPATMVVR